MHTLFLSKQKKYWYYDRRISCSSGFLKYSWKWECLRMFMYLFHHKVLENDVLLVLTVWLMVILLTSSFSLNKKWKPHSCCLFSVASNCLVWSLRMVEWLALLTSAHEVPGLNPTGGRPAHEWLYGASLHRAFHYPPSIVAIWHK